MCTPPSQGKKNFQHSGSDHRTLAVVAKLCWSAVNMVYFWSWSSGMCFLFYINYHGMVRILDGFAGDRSIRGRYLRLIFNLTGLLLVLTVLSLIFLWLYPWKASASFEDFKKTLKDELEIFICAFSLEYAGTFCIQRYLKHLTLVLKLFTYKGGFLSPV